MKQPPLFSVILPVYNVEKYIERCIHSLQNQSFNNYEIIFVDDCGQDSSIKKISKYAIKNSNITIASNLKNLGTYHARRKGVENANGKYIVFLDPDDELAPEFLAKLAQHVQLYQSDMVFYDIEYSPKKKFYKASQRTLPYSDSDNVLQAIQTNNGKNVVWAGTSGKVFSRSLLMPLYGKLNVDEEFRYVYTEDKLLYYAALLENPTFSVLDFKGYIYHNNDTSITNQKQLSNPSFLIEQLQFTTSKLKQLVADANLEDSDRQFFEFFLNESVLNQISLMRRYENGGKDYLRHVWSAFKAIPDIKQLIRIGLYLVSFKKIKI